MSALSRPRKCTSVRLHHWHTEKHLIPLTEEDSFDDKGGCQHWVDLETIRHIRHIRQTPPPAHWEAPSLFLGIVKESLYKLLQRTKTMGARNQDQEHIRHTRSDQGKRGASPLTWTPQRDQHLTPRQHGPTLNHHLVSAVPVKGSPT